MFASGGWRRRKVSAGEGSGRPAPLSQQTTFAEDWFAVSNNLEYGVAFEIVLCDTLSNTLPDRFGVCRGYVVTEHNESTGDDIVIFDRGSFPTLAMRRRDDWAGKEFVPAEAVYSYIEAKHTLHLTGDDGQSLSHACGQVQRVKQTASKRAPLPPTGGSDGPPKSVGKFE